MKKKLILFNKGLWSYADDIIVANNNDSGIETLSDAIG